MTSFLKPPQKDSGELKSDIAYKDKKEEETERKLNKFERSTRSLYTSRANRSLYTCRESTSTGGDNPGTLESMG